MQMVLTFVLWFFLIMLGVHVGYALIMASIFFFTASGGWNLEIGRASCRERV